MSQTPQHHEAPELPAMGERRARWGYGYQDKVATDRILRILKDDRRDGSAVFEGVRLADLQAGRVDDFVLVWNRQVEGHSMKWSGEASLMNWRDLIGAKGLLKELAQGFLALRQRWPNHTVTVRLQSNRPSSRETRPNQMISAFSVAEFLRDHWKKGPTAQDAEGLREAWGTIARHTGLCEADFGAFIKGCIFSLGFAEPPGSGPDTCDWRHYVRPFDALHKAIATWLTNNPNAADDPDRGSLASGHELTYQGYIRGEAQEGYQLIVWNREHQLVGPQYRWVAMNSNVARELGWTLCPTNPFEWLDSAGHSMVKSECWKDGWIWLEPPRFEALGEGWYVLASDLAVEAIRRAFPDAQTHLWVERHSHGQKPYKGSWHLRRLF